MRDILREKLIRTIIFAGLAAGSFFLMKLLAPAMIISLGIRTATAISTVIPIIFGAGFAVSSVRLISSAAKIHRQDMLEEKRLKSLDIHNDIAEQYRLDAGNPVNTRKRLEQIKESTPGAANLMDRCLSQLDRMDELQKRQQMLLESNDAAYLKDTVNTLEQVEHEICLNYRGIVNQCIVSGPTADESKFDMDKIERSLSKNQELLDQSKELLKVSADWIDSYNEQENPDRSLLDSWIRTIRNTINGGEQL